MAWTYFRSDLQNAILDTAKYPYPDYQIAIQAVLNRVVRKVNTELDLRSTKRSVSVTPTYDTSDYIYVVAVASDLKDSAFIDLRPASDRSLNSRLRIVPEEYFDRRKHSEDNLIAIYDDDGSRSAKTNLDMSGTTWQNVYYSKYPWMSVTGTRLENSAASTDYILAESDEFDLYVERGKVEVFKELRDYEPMKLAMQEYQTLAERYRKLYPSERLKRQNIYWY